ncbi:MAG: NAD(P)-dependent oxidoreductase [bacterium]|nr:NAD(P)-dependent oxidoreductase [bacterium]MDZ4285037.1 NAD(P)-dependent oxidoreductase [Patescibacteria group bacterium]
MQKVLVTGAGGLLGAELVHASRAGFEVVGLRREECDITDAASVRAILERERPDVIVNCAVVVSVDRCEQDPARCRAVNVGGVENLIEAVRESGQKVTFVEISSSEVFGRVNEGEYKIEGYGEDDEPRPVSLYQRTKAEAERVVQGFARDHLEALEHWYVVRAGWLYGAGRATFVDQFFEKLQRDEPLEVIVNQWRSPTWTKDFAAGLFDLLASGRESGIYHITNEVESGEASTLDVVEEITLTLGLSRVRAPLRLVSRDDIFKIPRAPSNVLKNTRLPKLRHWREAMREYLCTAYRQ